FYQDFPGTGKSGSNILLARREDELPRPYLHYNDFHEGGEQAMVIYFDNDGNTFIPGWYQPWRDFAYKPPFYSEVEAATTGPNSLGVGQDWTRQDIKALSLWFKGYPTRAGSAIVGAGPPHTATITAAGTDIGDVGPDPYHDEFHYAYRYLKVDPNFAGWGGFGTITAKVESVDNTNAGAKAGVMMRETPFPDSNFAMVVVTPEEGVSFQYRDTKRGAVTIETTGGITAPHWVRLTRASTGGLFTAEHANDVGGFPDIWSAVGADNTISIDMNPPDNDCLVGLCVTSQDADEMCQAAFSGVEIAPLVNHSMASGPWRSEDIGIISNDPAPLYVALEDVNNDVGVKYYDNPNAALITDWTEWNIDLADGNFSSVDLTKVDRVYIGLGDRDTPTTGGSGVLCIDDIRIFRSRYVPGYYPPLLGNIDGDPPDGVVDEKDVRVMAGDWLLADEVYPTTPPNNSRLVAHWPLDTDYNDYSGNFFHGTAMGDADLVTDAERGQVLILDGAGDYVDCGNPADLDFGTGNWSVCAWVKTTMTGTNDDPDKGVIYGKGGDGGGGHRYGVYVNENQGTPGRITLITDDDNDKFMVDSSVIVSDGDWHHVVGLRDINDLRLYIDGLPDGNDILPAGYDLSGTSQHNAYIGTITNHGADPNVLYKYLEGSVDDVRIYDYALSDAEVAYLPDDTPGDGQLHIPVASVANIYNEEPEGEQWVNFMDYAVLADDWLKEEPYWP
ncbi:MAG: LamG domain-containing protein, partial [Planctomycetota bacterium]